MSLDPEGIPIVVSEYTCIDCKGKFSAIGDIGAKRCARCWSEAQKIPRVRGRITGGEFIARSYTPSYDLGYIAALLQVLQQNPQYRAYTLDELKEISKQMGT